MVVPANLNSDDVNESLGLTDSDESYNSSDEKRSSDEEGDVSSVDANGNGQVTIQEAKDAGFSMPIHDDVYGIIGNTINNL